MTTMNPKEFCEKHDACSDGAAFAGQFETMAEVWAKCPRPDWLLWILDKLNRRPDDKTLRLFAVWCCRHTPLADGRTTWDLMTDERSRNAVDVAERFANEEERKAAWVAASEASEAARTASEAASSAASAASSAASAASSAASAASAAAWAASAAASAASSAAWVAASEAQATQLRTMVVNPFVIENKEAVTS